MYALIELGSHTVEEASPTVELFASKEVARLALAHKFVKLMINYHVDNRVRIGKRDQILMNRLDQITIAKTTDDRYWRTLEAEMALWHESYRTDLDWYTTFWIVETKPGKNPLVPGHIPGLPDIR